MYYPDEWKDDIRMDALFAPFRVRTLNPVNYDSKLKFWKNAITKYCLYKGESNINIKELKNAFQRKDKIPYVFPIVLEDMFQKEEVKLKIDFMEIRQYTWSGWAVNSLIKKPISKSFNKFKDLMIQSKDDSTEYVLIESLKNQATKIQKEMEHLTESVMSLADAIEKLTNSNLEFKLTNEGALLAIQQLENEQKVNIDRSESIDNYSKIIIKFSATAQKVTPINDLDRSIYNLEKTEKHLLKIIDKIENELKDLDIKIRELIRDGKRNSAKFHLRKKHVVEKHLEKRLNTLDQIQVLQSRIQDTSSDAKVLEAYKIGSKTIKNLLSDSGITLDSVDEALADVQETLELHDDIQSTLGGGNTFNTIDDSILEKELEELLLEDALPDVVPSDINKNDGNEKEKPKEAILNMDDSIERRLNELRIEFSDVSTLEENNEVLGSKR